MPRGARVKGFAAVVIVAAFAGFATPAAEAAGPKAALKFSPAKPAVGATLVLDASGSKCAPGPCKFLWTSETAGRKALKLGTARRVSVKLKQAGTFTVALRVTDARKRAATKRQKIVVSVGTPAPGFAPVFPAPSIVAPAPAPAPAPVATPAETATPTATATPTPTPPPVLTAPVITAPAENSLWNTGSIAVSGTAEKGTTVELLEGATSRGTVATDAAGAWSRPLTAADGTHVYTARATRAGSTPSSLSAPRTVRIDTVAPDTTIDSGPGGLTNAAALDFGFSANEAGSTFACRLDGPGGAGSFAACDSPKHYAGLADGAYTFRVRATDAAGNPDLSDATRSFTIDRTAPPAPAVTSPAEDALLNTATFAVTGTAEGGATVEVRENGSLLGGAAASVQGAWTVNVVGLTDGSHTLNVTARDGAGNTSPAAARTVRVDSAFPETTITSGTSGLTNATTVSFAFTASKAGSTFDCRLDGPGAATGTYGACTSPKAYTGLADGSYTFRVRATDPAGNPDPTDATGTFTMDRTAPAAPTVTANPLQGTTVTLSGTTEANAVIEIREAGNLVASADADAGGAWLRTLTAVAEGSHTYSVTARDGAGNTSPAASRTVVVDTTAPETMVDSGPPALSNAATVDLAFSASEPGATFSCRLDGPGAATGSYGACTSPKTYSGLPDGNYSFRVRATDAAGNPDQTDATHAFTIDRTAPAAPTITAPALQSSPVVALRGTTEANATIELSDGADALGSVTADGQGNWEKIVLGVKDGDHPYSATARDAAGNTSPPATRTVRVDTTPPVSTIDSGPPALTNADSVSFAFHASEVGSTFACRLDRGVEPGEWVLCDSPKMYANLLDGDYTFLVRATDPAGNTDPAAARRSVVVDRTAPAPPSFTSAGVQRSTTIVLGGTTEGFATIEIHEGATLLGTVSADAAGTWGRTFAGVAEGSHTYSATARDAAGNASAAASKDVRVDTVAPVVAITSGPNGTINENAATFEFASEPSVTFECRLDGPGSAQGEYAACASPYKADRLDIGDFLFHVRATDDAGNTGTATERAFAYAPPTADHVYVAADGADTADCTTDAPCLSLKRAYAFASDGGTIEIGKGEYTNQELPAGTKQVTVQGDGSRPELFSLDAWADNVTFKGFVVRALTIRGSKQVYDGVDVDGKFARRLAFEHLSGDDDVFKNGSIGNVTDEKGVIVGPKGFTFDRVTFHDVRVTDQAIHNECVYATGSEGLTIRRSTFHACATMDLFFTNFEGGPQYGNITLENNVFEHTTMEDPDSWHFYSMYVHQVVNGMRNWVVRYNTFETGVSNVFEPGTPASSGRWVGNVGDWECAAGMTYRYNLGMACNPDLDSGLFPAASTRTREAPFGWVNAKGYDFHLKSTSPAINLGDPDDFPATDRDGNPRNVGWAPDAGAYEYQTADTQRPKPRARG